MHKSDLADLIQLRHALHREPEISGEERQTAQKIVDAFQQNDRTRILTDLGGHGVAVVFDGNHLGPTVLFRCELDALRIDEVNEFAYRSVNTGVSHKCGHDGHMTVMVAFGRWLSKNCPKSGRVVLLFQPAEENGEGAKAVIEDRRFESIKPQYAFAFHNLPRFPLGQVVVRSEVFASASRGMVIKLKGKTAHASQPHTGTSPLHTMTRIIDAINTLSHELKSWKPFAMITLVGVRLGEKDFGVAPGDAEIWATLRSETDQLMDKIVDRTQSIVWDAAKDHGIAAEQRPISVDISYEEIFTASINSAKAVDLVRASVKNASMLYEAQQPFPWSEDFGRFSPICDSALFGIGAGVDTPDLHNPDYDFPNELIPIGCQIYVDIVRQILKFDE